MAEWQHQEGTSNKHRSIEQHVIKLPQYITHQQKYPVKYVIINTLADPSGHAV
jgi:hypothetical protein